MLSKLPLVHKTIFAIRGDSEDVEDFLLAIADPRIKNEDGEGRIIEQSNSRMYGPEVVFDAKGIVHIRRQNVLETIEVQCREDGMRFIIPMAEYKRISYEISNDPESSASEQSRLDELDEDSSSEDYVLEPEPQNTSEIIRKRGRPKGSKNKRKFGQHSESDRDDEFTEQQKRGRGRPKGSKNKKNLLKKVSQESAKDTFELRVLMSGYLKRGKGRPKGSKNKPKIKQEYTDVPIKEEATFWKRGKGRPKGSKNKIKNLQKTIEKFERLNNKDENKEKRNRGRPKGVKNRPKSQPSGSESSDPNELGMLPEIPDESTLQDIDCCRRCTNRQIKLRMLEQGNLQYWEELYKTEDMVNLAENLGLERRDNLFIISIQNNRPELLRFLIEKDNLRSNFFRCCWPTEGKLDIQKYSVKTSKDSLSRSGKQGITVLLHDCYNRKNEPWWKIVTVERILQSMTNQTNPQIINILIQSSPELRTEMISNIPTVIRAGNHEVTKIMLRQIKAVQFQYSREHEQCLQKDPQLPYKKMNILKKNSGPNYCSAIHCAAINPNIEILENLVKTFPNYNICDSLGRRPIHYASAVENSTSNLEVLLRNNSDLKDMDKMKMTPLMIAGYYGRCKIVKYILDRFTEPLYVNFKSDEGFSALHYAVLNNHEDCVAVMVEYQSVDINAETRDKQTAVHLAAGTGNVKILSILLTRNAYTDYYDRCKRTPFMFAIRNNNYRAFSYLMNEGVKLYKVDSSLNSMLHYAAAYGNYHILKYLLEVLKQTKNRENLYPWEIAVSKGHLPCAQILDSPNTVDELKFNFSGNILLIMMKNLVGTDECVEMIKYLVESTHFSINCQDYNGFTPLHYCCSLSEQDYIKTRIKEIPNYQLRQLKEEYKNLQDKVISLLLKSGSVRSMENKNKETAFQMCLENGNLTGIRLLMPDDVDLDYQTSNGLTLLHYLSSMASLGPDEIKFVYSKILQCDPQRLKESLKKVDNNGYEPLIHFVRQFTLTIKSNFHESIYRLKNKKASDPEIEVQDQVSEAAEAYRIMCEHQEQFLRLVKYFVDAGANVNATVQDKGTNKEGGERKWGIFHFLMKFPSLKLLMFFKPKVKDCNTKDLENRTPLHYFCIWNRKGSLLDLDDFAVGKEYIGENSLTYLLENGLNYKVVDIYGSTPLLYAALNKQIQFMIILGRFGSQFNICNKKNQVPLIQIMKLKDSFAPKEIEQLMKIGADPNFEDLEKRNSLHHLVFNSNNFDTSPQICRILFEYGAKINSLDKYSRTPIFYCFIDIDSEAAQQATKNDKVQIIQTLISHPEIDLNHVDIKGRTAIHYACEKDYFFSILYLLEKHIDITIKDREGNTPLAVCFLHKNINQAALLIKACTKEGEVNENGAKTSYFSYAFNKLSVGVCYMLLDKGYPIESALRQVSHNPAFKKILVKKYVECK